VHVKCALREIAALDHILNSREQKGHRCAPDRGSATAAVDCIRESLKASATLKVEATMPKSLSKRGLVRSLGASFVAGTASRSSGTTVGAPHDREERGQDSDGARQHRRHRRQQVLGFPWLTSPKHTSI
jgi:hypothetical protein